MNKFIMKRVTLTVLTNCNLNCKLCCGYSPYLRNNKQPSLEEILQYINKFFDIVDYVERFAITGGEPLLFKQLPEVINALAKYSDRIGNLEIITNGTIVPSEELIHSVNEFGGNFYRFMIDDYGENLSNKTTEISIALKRANLPYEIRNYTAVDPHCGGWVDYGLAKLMHTPEEAKVLFAKCAAPQKLNYLFGISNGVLTPCAIIRYRLYLRQNVDKNDYIDLMDETTTIEQQRRKISNIYNNIHDKVCLESCQYCNGMCDDSPRFAPAEQLTTEEIREIKQSFRAVSTGDLNEDNSSNPSL